MQIGEIIEIGEREIETPKIAEPKPNEPERSPERVKEPQHEDA